MVKSIVSRIPIKLLFQGVVDDRDIVQGLNIIDPGGDDR